MPTSRCEYSFHFHRCTLAAGHDGEHKLYAGPVPENLPAWVSESTSKEPSEPAYYISNRNPVGNCLMWWKVDGQGYTCNLDEAWRVPESKARQICRDRPEIDKMHEAGLVELAARRHVDFQILRALEDAANNWLASTDSGDSPDSRNSVSEKH